MSNGALRAAMWSLLCAVLLIGSIAFSDPRTLQVALSPSTNTLPRNMHLVANRDQSIAGPSDPILPELASTEITPSADLIAPLLDAPNIDDVEQFARIGLPHTPVDPAIRIAASDVRGLQLGPGSRKPATASTGIGPGVTLSAPRPPMVPSSIGHELTERPVPEPMLFDPFDDEPPIANVEMIDEQRVEEVAAALIDERLDGLREEVSSVRDSVVEMAAIAEEQSQKSDDPPSVPYATERDDGRYELTLVGSTVAEAVRLIGELGGVNLVMPKPLEATIHYDLHGVSLEEAIEMLVDVHDLTAVNKDGYVLVAPAEPPATGPSHLPLVIPGVARPSEL